MTNPNKDYLFVYGTLRRDYGHNLMREIAGKYVFTGQGKVKGALYDIGNYPGAVEGEGIKEIIGDVYEIADTRFVFRILDKYEGKEYCRHRTTVLLESGEKIEAFVYWYTGTIETAPQIDEDDYIEYLKNKKDRFL